MRFFHLVKMAKSRRIRRRKVIEYVLLAILVLGLAVLVYWIVVEKPGKRYPGLERIRGEQMVPEAGEALRASQLVSRGPGSPGL